MDAPGFVNGFLSENLENKCLSFNGLYETRKNNCFQIRNLARVEFRCCWRLRSSFAVFGLRRVVYSYADRSEF